MASTPELLQKIAGDLYKESLNTSDFSEMQARRAVSTAYYAVFHLFCEKGIVLLMNDSCDLNARYVALRSFHHKTMKKVCEGLVIITDNKTKNIVYKEPKYRFFNTNTDIALMAKNFIKLQEDRHNADYNMSGVGNITGNYNFNSQNDLRTSMDAMDEVFVSWYGLAKSNKNLLEIFVALMLFDDITYLHIK